MALVPYLKYSAAVMSRKPRASLHGRSPHACSTPPISLCVKQVIIFKYCHQCDSRAIIRTSAFCKSIIVFNWHLGKIAGQSVQSMLSFLSKASGTYHSMRCTPDVLHQACNWGTSQPTMAYRNTQSLAYKTRSTRIVSLRSTWCTRLIAIANPSPPKKDFHRFKAILYDIKKMRRMGQRQPFKKAAQYRSESMLVWDHDACRTRNFCNE